MKKKIAYLITGVIVVGVMLAGLLSIIDTLAKTPPTNIEASPSTQPQPIKAIGQNDLKLLKDLPVDSLKIPDTPLFELNGPVSNSLLRSNANLNNDGKLWDFISNSEKQNYTGGKIDPPVNGYSGKTTANITVNTLQDFSQEPAVLPTSLYTTSVNSPYSLIYLPQDQLFFSEQGLPGSYSFQTNNYQFDQTTLANAQVAQNAQYLKIPEGVTDRISELSRQITYGIESPYRKAEAIQDYLKANYTYSYDAQPAPEGQNPNDWFLFDEKQGVCTDFNSAFVTLARCAGLPSRLVGGYKVDPETDIQNVYANQAHAWSEVEFEDIGWQTFDATGIPPSAVPTTTEITSVNTVVLKGSSFNVQGTVTSPSTTVEGMTVELYINRQKSHENGIQIGIGQVNEGKFNIEARIPNSENVGDYQLIAHSVSNKNFQDSWSDPIIKVTADTVMNIDTPLRVRYCDSLEIKGVLKETTDNPVKGQTVQISVNGNPVNTTTTDEKGQFNWETNMNSPGQYILDFSFKATKYYAGTSIQAVVQVLLPARIILDPIEKTQVNENILLSGTLSEDISGDPIQKHTIDLLINKELVENNAETDENGHFTIPYTFNNKGIYQVEVASRYTDRFWEARKSAAVEVISSQNKFPWLYLLSGIAVLASAIGIYFIHSRIKFNAQTSARQIPAAKIENTVPAMPVENTPKPILQILFPGILPAYPDVWGINDILDIKFKLLDAGGHYIAGATITVQINNKAESLVTNEQGTTDLPMVFSCKGIYDVEAMYLSVSENIKISIKRSIKIVEYREEIIELFNLLVNQITEKGFKFPKDATPRELQEIIINAKLNIPQNILTELTACFEEADYSLHPVKRDHYLRMYKVQKDIREYVR
jgi:transglutaminase-like putative cysteine protease